MFDLERDLPSPAYPACRWDVAAALLSPFKAGFSGDCFYLNLDYVVLVFSLDH
jgi:hypothetical protein